MQFLFPRDDQQAIVYELHIIRFGLSLISRFTIHSKFKMEMLPSVMLSKVPSEEKKNETNQIDVSTFWIEFFTEWS